jgi:hypothetical protein
MIVGQVRVHANEQLQVRILVARDAIGGDAPLLEPVNEGETEVGRRDVDDLGRYAHANRRSRKAGATDAVV